ncbi:MAG: hypothetical protein ACTIA5_01540 [Brachybacterium tyrofermentans]
MTSRHRRYLGRAARRRQQHVPIHSQQVAMTYSIDRGGFGLASARALFGPAIEYVIRMIQQERPKSPPLIHNGRKPRCTTCDRPMKETT